MAADYRYIIKPEFHRQFNIEGYYLNFNIYDKEKDLYLNVDPKYISAKGAFSTDLAIEYSDSDDYTYRLVVKKPSATFSDDYSERVLLYYSDELCFGDVVLYQIGKIPKSIELAVGEEYYFVWTPGVVECINVLDKYIIHPDHSKVIGLKSGKTSFNLLYLLDDNHTPYISPEILVTVYDPSISDTTIDNISYNSATLYCDTIPNDVTAVKFRYGPAASFDPNNSTTYIEVEAKSTRAPQWQSNIDDLLPGTEYAVQSVMYAFGNIYYDRTENFITFTTLSTDPGEVIFNKPEVNMLSTDTGITLTASLKNSLIKSCRWYTTSDKISLSDIYSETVIINSMLVDAIDPEDEIGVPLYVEVTDLLDNKVVGNIKVNIYGVQGVIYIYIDESIPTSTGTYLRNPSLVYNYIKTEQTKPVIYSYDPDTDVITAIDVGERTMTANVSLPNSTDLVNKTYITRIIIRESFTAPTLEEIISRGVIYNYPEELFGANGNRLYKELNKDNKDLPHCYCFKTNGNELPWEYDIALMDDDIDKFNLNKLTN